MVYRIAEWEINVNCVHGRVYGNPKFINGSIIHTSHIISIEEKQNCLIAKTMNSTYQLDIDKLNIRSDLLELTSQALISFGVSNGFSEKVKAMKRALLRLEKKYLSLILKNCEVCLVFEEGVIYRGYFKRKGNLYCLRRSKNIGVFENCSIWSCRYTERGKTKVCEILEIQDDEEFISYEVLGAKKVVFYNVHGKDTKVSFVDVFSIDE